MVGIGQFAADGHWVTMDNGEHLLIREGESVQEALRNPARPSAVGMKPLPSAAGQSVSDRIVSHDMVGTPDNWLNATGQPKTKMDLKNIMDSWQHAGLKGHPAVMLQKAYEVEDKGSGLKTVITKIYADNGSVRVYGTIQNSIGGKVGAFTRFIKPDGAVVHELFYLNEHYEGTGFGSLWVQHCEAQYKAAGVKAVKLHANLDVGGYAWAKMGFDFAMEMDKDNVVARIGKAYRKQNNEPIPKDVSDALHGMHAWELAAFKDEKGNPIGKQGMLGSDWLGYKDLSPGSEHTKVGDMYFGTKAKKKA